MNLVNSDSDPEIEVPSIISCVAFLNVFFLKNFAILLSLV